MHPGATARVRASRSEGDLVGTVAGTASLFEGDPFWDPVSFSWPLMLILLAL